MGDVAASGGYYIAVASDAIVAEPATITGSIGVVTGKFVLKGTLDKIGVGVDSVSEGKMAEIESPFRPFTDAERARLDEQMHAVYDMFLAHVAEGRKTTPEKVDAIGQGRVWTGRQARDLNLVDELGGLDVALRLAKQHAKLDPSREVQLVVYPAKRSLFDFLSNPFGPSTEAALSLLLGQPEARVVHTLASRADLFRRGEMLTLMPNIYRH